MYITPWPPSPPWPCAPALCWWTPCAQCHVSASWEANNRGKIQWRPLAFDHENQQLKTTPTAWLCKINRSHRKNHGSKFLDGMEGGVTAHLHGSDTKTKWGHWSSCQLMALHILSSFPRQNMFFRMNQWVKIYKSFLQNTSIIFYQYCSLKTWVYTLW